MPADEASQEEETLTIDRKLSFCIAEEAITAIVVISFHGSNSLVTKEG